jgi:hypothetical protein
MLDAVKLIVTVLLSITAPFCGALTLNAGPCAAAGAGTLSTSIAMASSRDTWRILVSFLISFPLAA